MTEGGGTGGGWEEDGEEVGEGRGWGGGRRREGSRVAGPGSGSPGVPERPNDPDVLLQRDDCFGNCKSPAPGGPSLGQGEVGGKELEREKGERQSERNLRKREI